MFSLNKDFTAIFSRKYGGIFLAHLGAALVSAAVGLLVAGVESTLGVSAACSYALATCEL